MSKEKVLLYALAGLATGALLGVLFAPDKGARTRKKILEKGADSAEELNDKFDELLESLTEKLQNAKQQAASVYEKGKSKLSDIKKAV